jgi:hypothetical protein
VQSTRFNGITIQEPYLSQILDGSKVWEYRRYDLPDDFCNVPVLLLSRSQVRGYVVFSHSAKLEEPQVFTLANGRQYRATHAWRISQVGRIKHAVRYRPVAKQSLVRNVETDADITEESFG